MVTPSQSPLRSWVHIPIARCLKNLYTLHLNSSTCRCKVTFSFVKPMWV